MSKLREDEAKKRKLQEANDVLLEIGKEGKEGVKAYKEYAKGQEKKEQDQLSHRREYLQEREGDRFTYNKFLAGILAKEMQLVSFPLNWTYKIAPNDIGVILELKSPDGRFFRSAFRASGDGLLDLNAVKTFVVRAENVIDRVTHRDNDAGIILPK